ncbi:DEAD/DEAH box helicase [Rhodospirillaceae bacterium SYSU D60014]|uniref:DEAD/DEAH box helicase n=1 Tax=Virgifigura deserti TaxID=2268457 RepID=UPI000E673340
MSFSDLSLHPLILKALDAAGYAAPTPVQAQAIPPALTGRDLLATAETGTGKTAAFVLPALQRIAAAPKQRQRGPRVLILTPTRELASQVTKAARAYGKFLRLNTIEIVGGMPYRQQLQLMAKPLDIVVATPGRLIDHLERRRIDLSEVEFLVLDEADRMLDMGFVEAVEKIASACPATRQTLLFTATLDRRVAKVAATLLRTPQRIAIARATSAPDIEQRMHQVDDLAHKHRLLHHWAASGELTKGIVFAATKRDVDALARELAAAGHAAAPLHGDMDQRARSRTLDRLRSGAVRLLVATDVAARGIDVRDITHVINFDLPRNAEDYVHRIGRTGRAGASGVAISFAAGADRGLLALIERFTGTPLSVHIVPGLEPAKPFARGTDATRKRPFRHGGQRTGKPSAGKFFNGKSSTGKPFAGKRKAAGPRPTRVRRMQDGARQ